MIFTANPQSLDDLWPHALPHLERFSKETQLTTPEDIYAGVMDGSKQLWMMEQESKVCLVVATEIWTSAAGSICTIRTACGDVGHDALRTICAEIERWARERGCVAIEICGRKGWSRVLDGFKQSAILLEKDLRQVH